jgi:hypothetical protein
MEPVCVQTDGGCKEDLQDEDSAGELQVDGEPPQYRVTQDNSLHLMNNQTLVLFTFCDLTNPRCAGENRAAAGTDPISGRANQALARRNSAARSVRRRVSC